VRVLDPRLVRRARAVQALLVVDAALGVAMALLVLAQAVLLARVAARSVGGASLDEVAWPLVALACVVGARALATWGFEVAGRRAAVDVISRLRRDVVDARLRRDPTALDGVQSAEVATAAVSGVDALETTFARYVPQTVLAVVVPAAVLVLVASLDLLAAGLMLLTLPLVPVFMWLVGRYTERRARERWQSLALLSNHFLDVVRGLPTLRAFNRSTAQRERIAEVSESYRRSTMGTLRVAFLSGAILELAATLGIALVAVVVGVRLAEGGIAFEPALTILVLAPELYLPLRTLATQWHASADGAAVAERLLDVVEASRDACDDRLQARDRGTADVPNPAVEPIRFEDVSFRYPSREVDVVRGCDVRIGPGETVALVGASGAGKSTLLMLLLGFAAPTGGRILVGDADLADLDPVAWRRLIAYVPQRPALFRGTVADNIRLGDAAAPDDRVRRAAALAHVDEFVARLPSGFETVVGEGGRGLSSGQIRRIALARAFLRDAPLVLLDEPTADLDPGTAAVVADGIERLRDGRTVLLVAHRRALADRADRVVRLEDGRTLAEVAA
jgi:thiol reductant ABC exporter CydD subunit